MFHARQREGRTVDCYGRMRRADHGSGPEPQRGVFRLRRGCLIRSHVLDVVADRHQTIRYRPARRSYQPCRS